MPGFGFGFWRAGQGPFTPQKAFGADLVQLFDARSGVFSDSGSTEITAGGTVQQWNDLSSYTKNLSQTTALNKPTWNTDSGLSWVASDGSDDFMASAAVDLSGTAQVTIFAGVRKLADTAGIIGQYGNVTVGGSGGLGLGAASSIGDASRRTYYMDQDYGAGQVAGCTGGSYTAPHSAVITGQFDRSQATQATELALRVNGVSAGALSYSNANTATGNFGSNTLRVGYRADSTQPFNGRIYCFAVVKRACTAAEITAMEAWVNARTGAY